jgi:cysteine synthase
MPDDQSHEKKALLEKLGATVSITASCSISNKDHYVNTARRKADEIQASQLQPGGPGAIFMDQFENEANYKAHYEGTGPEIWRQMGEYAGGGAGGNAGHESECRNSSSSSNSSSSKRMDAFVMSAGTGGTIAGVSRYLKEQDPRIRVLLADPTGSSLLHRVRYQVCFAPQQAERGIRRHRYDSIVEGVGLDRVTANFAQARIDDGFLIGDQEIVDTAHWLLRNEGLFVGSSTALNVAAAVRTALQLAEERRQQSQLAAAAAAAAGKGQKECSSSSSGGDKVVVVTVVCDSGTRHLSRLWSPEYIAQHYGLSWPAPDVVPACLKALQL